MAKLSKRKRTQTGTAVTEAGPMLFLVLFLFFFPIIDLIGVGVAYAVCFYYNDLELRELAISNITDCGASNPTSQTATTSDGGAVHKSMVGDFSKTGLASFLFHNTPTVETITSKVEFQPPKDYLTQATIIDETTFHKVPPFIRLQMPLLTGIPGLDSDFDVVVRQSRSREELR